MTAPEPPMFNGIPLIKIKKEGTGSDSRGGCSTDAVQEIDLYVGEDTAEGNRLPREMNKKEHTPTIEERWYQ